MHIFVHRQHSGAQPNMLLLHVYIYRMWSSVTDDLAFPETTSRRRIYKITIYRIPTADCMVPQITVTNNWICWSRYFLSAYTIRAD